MFRLYGNRFSSVVILMVFQILSLMAKAEEVPIKEKSPSRVVVMQSGRNKPVFKNAGDYLVVSPDFLPTAPGYANHENVAKAGAAFGLVGSAVVALALKGRDNLLPEKSKAFGEKMAEMKFDFLAYYESQLKIALQKLNVAVEEKVMPRLDMVRLMENYPVFAGSDTFYVDSMNWSAGYREYVSASGFLPSVRVFVQLAKGPNEVLLQKVYGTDPREKSRDAVPGTSIYALEQIVLDSKYQFANYDDLLNDPQRAKDGLSFVIDAIAVSIASEMKNRLTTSSSEPAL